MKQIKVGALNLTVKDTFNYQFDVPETGLHAIEIIAGARSWWQNVKSWRAFFNDDDLAVTLDGAKFHKLNGKKGLFDGEASWNGNNLKGLAKTVLIVANLNKGSHELAFKADVNPVLQNIAIWMAESKEIKFTPIENNPPQDGNRRQWMTIILLNLPLKHLQIKALASNYPKLRDDDDIKLIINGKIQQNSSDKSHQDWYWCGRILQDREKTFAQDLNLPAGLHYVELWADKTPTLKKILLELEETSEQGIKIQTYNSGPRGENYNQYDQDIYSEVNKWNNQFAEQQYPPLQALDPNLVKAMIYVESRMGYGAPNGDYPSKPDIMQVANPSDQAGHVLKAEPGHYEYEWDETTDKIALLSYPEMKVASTRDSIHWGTRWLFHKSQQNLPAENRRTWKSWTTAVHDYNGSGDPQYVQKVLKVYREGVGPQKEKIWAKAIVFLLIAAMSCGLYAGTRFYEYNTAVAQDHGEHLLPENIPSVNGGTHTLSIEGSLSQFISYQYQDCKTQAGTGITKMLRNGYYQTWKQGLTGLTTIQLRDGFHFYTESLSPSKKKEMEFRNFGDIYDGPYYIVLEHAVEGDLNGDGKEDAVAVLGVNYGGTGYWPQLAVVVQGEDGIYRNISFWRFADRDSVNCLKIQNGVIQTQVMLHGPDDPLCCASIRATKEFRLVDGKLRLE